MPTPTTIPTVISSIARFDQIMLALTQSHAASATTLSQLEQERQALDEQETQLRAMIGKAEDRRSWFAAFKEWIESVGAFLDEKVCLSTVLNLRRMSNAPSIRCWKRWKMSISPFSGSAITWSLYGEETTTRTTSRCSWVLRRYLSLRTRMALFQSQLRL